MKQKIDMSELSETMLVPLYARARESKKKNPAFYDKTAVNVINQLDYDFDKNMEKTSNKLNFWGCAARTILFDDEAREFIERYPDCSVVNIACGLDDRFSRVDNGKIKWYNIDFQEIIDLRKKLIEKNDRVINIACSALDFAWVDEIENKENVLIIAEGFLMYLEEEEVRELFTKIALSFENVELLIEIMSEWMVENQKMHETVKSMGVQFKWGLKELKDFEKICPSYRILAEYDFTDKMKMFSPILITIISPFLKSRNNSLGKYVKILFNIFKFVEIFCFYFLKIKD